MHRTGDYQLPNSEGATLVGVGVLGTTFKVDILPYKNMCQGEHVCVCVSVYLSVCLSVCLCVGGSQWCLSVCLSVCLWVGLSGVCLSVCVWVGLIVSVCDSVLEV